MRVTFTKNVKYNDAYYDKDVTYDLSDADVKVLKSEQGDEVFTSSTAPEAPISKPVETEKAQARQATPPASNPEGSA